MISLSFLYKTPAGKSLNLHWAQSLSIAVGLAFLAWFLGKIFVGRIVIDEEEGAEGVERIFRKMQVGTSCYVALSQGANDVANAIGPVAAIYLIAKEHMLFAEAEVPLPMLMLGGLGIAIGIALLGHKVMATVGQKITTLTNTRGFAVDFGAASTVLVASNLGLPVSHHTCCRGRRGRCRPGSRVPRRGLPCFIQDRGLLGGDCPHCSPDQHCYLCTVEMVVL